MTDEHTELLDLDYTRSKRMQLINSITEKGVPADLKDRSILLQALDGMDRAALSKMKIKSDEGISNGQAAAAAILAELFNDPRTRNVGKSNDLVGSVQVLSIAVQPDQLLPGELDINPVAESYDSFMARTTPAVSA